MHVLLYSCSKTDQKMQLRNKGIKAQIIPKCKGIISYAHVTEIVF